MYKKSWMWNYVEKRIYSLCPCGLGEIARFQGIHLDYDVAKADICISPRSVTLLSGREAVNT